MFFNIKSETIYWLRRKFREVMTESGDQAGVSLGNQEEDNSSWLYTDNKENGSTSDSSKKVNYSYTLRNFLFLKAKLG